MNFYAGKKGVDWKPPNDYQVKVRKTSLPENNTWWRQSRGRALWRIWKAFT